MKIFKNFGFAPILLLLITIVLFVTYWYVLVYDNVYTNKHTKEKEYPVEVHYRYNIGYNTISGTMEVDSVRGNVVYKDGQWIMNKNIINVKFK